MSGVLDALDIPRDSAAFTARARTALLAREDARGATTRTAVVAQDELARARIEKTLEGAGIVVVASASAVEVLGAAAGGADVVVAVADGRDGLAQVRADLPGAAVVVVGPAGDSQAVRRAVRAGAIGYVREDEVEHVLPLTTRAVAAGQFCVPPDVRAPLVPVALSLRERQVLQLVAQGRTNAQIAAQLFLAESTVKSHLSTGFRKLGVTSRAEAAAAVLDPDRGLELLVLRTGE